jgi:hypothetical protein
LHELVQGFVQSEQYLTIKRLARVINEGADLANNPIGKPLGTLIRRYPYLYTHCLLNEDSAYEHQQTVRQIQAQVQRQYEIDLSQYVTYQVRRSRASRTGSLGTGHIIQPVTNPTLLSDRELFGAIKQFVGKAEGSYSYRDLAQRFLTHTSQTTSFGAFKDDLYEYITSSVDPSYGKRQFNDRLYKQLQTTLPQSDSQKLSDFLIVRTCSQLLNFVVVDNPQRPNHFIFIDLMTNLGATMTTGLLIKIVLICRKVKPYLEKRFSILFDHYESHTGETIHWLVKGLENLNIAMSTHFGSLDLSFVSKLA